MKRIGVVNTPEAVAKKAAELEAAKELVLGCPTISVPVGATLYGISPQAMYRHCAEGQVQAIRIGRRWRILSAPLREALQLVEDK
ncbi:helix-turn-helix domain-containing protein [Rhodococcus globerulus]|uniref:helix-turn-helix domain-containing protein n=1 Tax=Rhodococcus globerulus TaxID=33008 RepID=UPI003016D224